MMAFVKALGKLASLMTVVGFQRRGYPSVVCQRVIIYYRTASLCVYLFHLCIICIIQAGAAEDLFAVSVLSVPGAG